MDDAVFANFFYPDFKGIMYMYNPKDDRLIFGPYFYDKQKAEYVSEEISKWNQNFIKISYIEHGQNEYAFVAYQDPQGSFDKLAFSLYRSSMNRQGNYSNFKNRLKSKPSEFRIFFLPDSSNLNSCVPIGDLKKISECKIISESELSEYPLEKEAHRICRATHS